MPIPNNIQTEIKKFFTKLSAIDSQNKITEDGNKYELFIYCLVHKALSKSFTLKAENLQPSNKFVFRCSPGLINKNFSYFSFTKGLNKYELRNGIEVIGHSMEHEIDILVIKAVTNGFTGKIPMSELRLAIECKFYSPKSSLKGEVRKFLGMMSDFSKTAEPMPLGGKAGCVHLKYDFYMGFVTNRNNQPLAEGFLKNYELNPRFGILPHSTNANKLVYNIGTRLSNL